MRVLVTGSRDWTDTIRLSRVLHDVVEDLGLFPMVLMQGDCTTGADALAVQWWTQKFGAQYIEHYPAQWDMYGPGAGPQRNQQMINAGPDLVVAFQRPCRKHGCQRREVHPSHGTADCIHRARMRGIPVMEHRAGFPGEDR